VPPVDLRFADLPAIEGATGRFLLQQMAAVAELEAGMISARTKAALAAGKALFQMMGVFAEFERAMIQERVRAGLRRARDEGKRLGRPKIAAHIEAAIHHSPGPCSLLGQRRGHHSSELSLGPDGGAAQ